MPDESVPVRSDGLETETFLVNILSAGSLADSSEDKEHLISHRHHVIQCVCVCDFVPSDPDPKESQACEALDKVCVCVCVHFSQERSWAEAGRVTRGEGRRRGGEGGREGASDDAAGLKIAPPPYPFCPRRFPPQSLHLLPPSLHHLFL